MQTKTTILSGLAGSDDALVRVQRSLLSCPMVADCAVLFRPLAANSLLYEPVAYVVASGSFLPERLHSYLQSRLSESDLPVAYVPLASLPLTEAGEIDTEALSRLEVIDAALVSRWEEELKAVADIAEAAVVVQDATDPLPPVHLSDLLDTGNARQTAKHTDEPASTLPVPGPQVPQGADLVARDALLLPPAGPMALSDGGPLVIPPDAPRTLTDALYRTAVTHPTHGVTYVHADGSEEFQSYASLLEEAKRILTGLQAHGLVPGDRVILQIASPRDHFSTLWACILGGIIPATVAIAPSYQERNGVLTKLHSAWHLLEHPRILTSDHLVGPISGLSDLMDMEGLEALAVDSLRRYEPTGFIHPSRPEDLIFFQLTSGSTGIPKCILETHRSIVAHAHGTQQFNGLGPDDVFLNWLPADHVGAIIYVNLKSAYLGSSQIHIDTDAIISDPLKWLDIIEEHRATHTWSPNFGYQLVNDHLAKSTGKTWDLTSIKSFMNAGEQATLSVVRDFLSFVAPFGVSQHVLQPAFGMAESCTLVANQQDFSLETGVNRFLKSSLSGSLVPTDRDDATTIGFIHLGRPIPGVQIRITDSDNNLVPEGVIGRFQLKGDVITPGYLKNDAANQEAFVEDGWFNSGDMGFILQGCLTLTGREKETIVVRGANFYCHEIEDVVNTIEEVEPTFAAACAVADVGTGTEGLAIFFVPKSIFGMDLARLIKTIRARVTQSLGISPTYFIPLERKAFPKTTSGKIQRSQLKQALEAGEFDAILKQVDILSGSANTLPDWFYRPIWRRKEAFLTDEDPVSLRRTLVFVGPTGLGDAVCDRLIAEGSGHLGAGTGSEPDVDGSSAPCVLHQGVACIRVEAGSGFSRLSDTHYRIDPSDPSHYHRLIKAVSAEGGAVQQIVHLWTYDAYTGEPSTLDALEHAQQRGLYSLLFLVQALAEVQDPEHSVRLLVVSSHAQVTRPEDVPACERAPLLGLVKALSQEMPYLTCTHLDLPMPRLPRDLASDESAAGREEDAHAAFVLTELAQTTDREAAYRDGHRLVVRLQRVDLVHAPKQEPPFKAGGKYLLTGGLGGIGVEVAKHLLSHYNARLLLIGRAPLSEHLEAYQSLLALGGEVCYEAVDVCDLDGLRSVVARAEAGWGGCLDGVLHLAGLYQAGLVVEETRESFSAAIRPKVGGSWTLSQLMKERPDAIFIGFSSTTNFFDQAMFGAYAAGNRYLDSLCHALRRQGIRSTCFGWSAWKEIGMSRAQPGRDPIRTTGRGFQALSAEQGINSLLAGVVAGQSHLLVGPDAGHPYIRRHCELPAGELRAQRLCGYFTTAGASAWEDGAGLEGLVVRDRFGTVSVCRSMRLGEMPRTQAGEIDREQLVERDGSKRSGNEVRVGPRTPTEEWLVETWQTHLGIRPIGIHDNFFEVGGHSLIATQVISRIRNTFRIELPLQALFEAPTISALAERISAERGGDGAASPPLARISREDWLPLSFSQQRLWFLDQFGPGSAVYNLPTALRLTGALDVEALERSLQEIVRRHEALRTTFKVIDNEPIQVIGASAGSLDRIDLSSFASEARDAEARRLVQEEAQRPFDLVQGPLFRTSLLQLEDEERLLLLTMHHIVSDGWSMRVLMRELETLYNAFSTGKPSPLPELPIQYADYAVWQRGWLTGEALDRQIGYWKERLDGAPALLELPTDRPRPAAQTYQGAIKRSDLPVDLTQKLKAIGQQEGATLFMTLLAAFQILLSRYSGQDDIVVGTPIANRTHAEAEGLIGFFVNTLALRGDLSGDPSFRELLGRVREAAIGAYAHQDLPFEKLVNELQPERSLSHSPIFQVVFVLQNAPYEKPDLKGVETEVIAREGVTAKFDLVLEILEKSGKLDVCLEYNTDLFDAERIERLLQHLHTLHEGIVTDPQQRISRLPLLSESERQHLLVDRNPTTHFHSSNRCLHELFEEQAERTPEAVAVSFEHQQLTYRQLNERANQLAHCLRKLGVIADTLVGLCLDRSLEMVVGVLGILKAGGAYVPLDPAYPPERLAFMLADAGLRVVVTTTDARPNLPTSKAHLLCLDEEAALANQSCNNPASAALPANLAYVIYTSGSTGRPKGVMITHENVTRLMAATEGWFHFDEHDVWTLFHSLAFDFSVWELWGPLLYGGKLVVVPYFVSRSPDDFRELLVREGVTILNQTPSAFRQLLACLPSEESGKALAIRRVIFGGEALEPASLERWYDLFGREDVRLINMYGITETTVHVTYREMGFEDVAQRRGSLIGGAILDLRLYLLDAAMQLVPVGVAGEIYVGGAGLARGYLGRPELTAERFVPDPFSGEAGSRLYRSGDLARYHWNGELEYLGRADDQVKIRGFRIELGEVESVLLAHPDVRETMVLAREDVPGETRLAAYVVGQDRAVNTGELRDYLRDRLPEYMIPSAFVNLVALPLTPNGKVDRKALPMPEAGADVGHEVVAPRTPIEEELAEIWCAVLHLRQVGIHDDFFELGGHSLLATQVISRVRETFQIDIPLRVLFGLPTIAGLASTIEQARIEAGQEQEEDLARLLAELEELSDEEALALLEENDDAQRELSAASPGSKQNVESER